MHCLRGAALFPDLGYKIYCEFGLEYTLRVLCYSSCFDFILVKRTWFKQLLHCWSFSDPILQYVQDFCFFPRSMFTVVLYTENGVALFSCCSSRIKDLNSFYRSCVLPGWAMVIRWVLSHTIVFKLGYNIIQSNLINSVENCTINIVGFRGMILRRWCCYMIILLIFKLNYSRSCTLTLFFKV